MTTQMKKQKVSKGDKLETISFCLRNRGMGIRPNPKCNIKMLDLLIDKYSIDFEREFILMKEEREKSLKEKKERQDKEEEKREIEKEKEKDDYKNLPWRIKNMFERVYTDIAYTEYIKFIRAEINHRIYCKSRCVTEEEVRNHNTYLKNYPRDTLDEYFPYPFSECKTSFYRGSYKCRAPYRELFEELKLDEWYNAKVVRIHRKKKNLY